MTAQQSTSVGPSKPHAGGTPREGLRRAGRAFWQMTVTELKLFFREPAAAFFTIAFPLIVLAVFGGIFGNDPDPDLGGRGGVDTSVPGYIGMIIGSTALVGLPVLLATYRDTGILRRLRATPVRPWVILGAEVAVNLLATLLGVGLLILAGRLIFDLSWPTAPIPIMVVALLFCCLSFYALGFALAGLLRTPRTAQAVGSAAYFPMLFLSGASFPRELFPDTVRTISAFLPLTQVVILLQGLWYDNRWDPVATTVVAGVLIVSVAISARTFRWE